MLKLNPSKHIFMVKLRKLVGFIMRSKDIKDDPNKVKAIQIMLESRIEKKKSQKLFMAFKLHSSFHFLIDYNM